MCQMFSSELAARMRQSTANSGVYTYQPGECAVVRPEEQPEETGSARLQTITIGPVSQGDADAILALCKERELDKLGLYRSAWADETAG